MARLPTSGSTVATPHLDEADLRNVLAQLCPNGEFSESDISEFYGLLARIIGQWSAEDNRLDIAPLAKTFTAMGQELKKVAEILSGHETGLRDPRHRDCLAAGNDPRTGPRGRFAPASG
jgi:hypothetical protein